MPYRLAPIKGDPVSGFGFLLFAIVMVAKALTFLF